MKKVLLFLSILTASIFANDTYLLEYILKESKCLLKKNGKNIELFDKRFKLKKPKHSYSCSALQKEQYKECKVLEKKNVRAQILAYGLDKDTNFVLAFRVDDNGSKSYSKIRCSR